MGQAYTRHSTCAGCRAGKRCRRGSGPCEGSPSRPRPHSRACGANTCSCAATTPAPRAPLCTWHSRGRAGVCSHASSAGHRTGPGGIGCSPTLQTERDFRPAQGTSRFHSHEWHSIRQVVEMQTLHWCICDGMLLERFILRRFCVRRGVVSRARVLPAAASTSTASRSSCASFSRSPEALSTGSPAVVVAGFGVWCWPAVVVAGFGV